MTVFKAREKHTQARNRERIDGERGIVDNDTPRKTAKTLVNELVSVLYPCHSDVQLFRAITLVEMNAITIDMNRTSHISTKSIRRMLLHLGYFTEHGTYQRLFTTENVCVASSKPTSIEYSI
jgi:hypothetical protein